MLKILVKNGKKNAPLVKTTSRTWPFQRNILVRFTSKNFLRHKSPLVPVLVSSCRIFAKVLDTSPSVCKHSCRLLVLLLIVLLRTGLKHVRLSNGRVTLFAFSRDLIQNPFTECARTLKRSGHIAVEPCMNLSSADAPLWMSGLLVL